MKVLSILGVILVVALLGCGEDQDTCTQPPNMPATVYITYPTDNSSVFEIAKVTCMVAENDGIKKVTLWVDGYHIPGAEDSSEPYELYWNTAVYEDYSSHTIIARVLDVFNHITDSEPINVIVDNTDHYPSQVNIQSIVYQDDSFIITWRPSRDSDFHQYYLYQSFYRDMRGKTGIYSSTSVSDTTHVVDNITLNEIRHYQLSVVDTVGLETLSQVFTGSSSDLVAYFPFNGNANDEGGNELHGTVYGAVLTEDRLGNPNSAYHFDGDFDMIDLNEYPEFRITGDLTISLWMKAISFNEGIPSLVNCQIHSEEPEGNALYGLSFYEPGKSIVYFHEYGFGVDHNHEFSEYVFEVNEWYHIAIARDTVQKKVELYVNGIFIGTDNYSENPYNGGLTGLAIGENQGSVRSDRFYNGILDEIYIYKRVLSQTEIEGLYNQ
jgi:hypothetical protein